MNEQEMNEKNIKENCCNALKEYLQLNKTVLSEISPEIINKIQDINADNIILGERPRFQNYYFDVTVTAAVMYDSEYYNFERRCIDTKPKHFYNLVCQPFSGYAWVMDNEDESDIEICNINSELVNIEKNGNYYALSKKYKIAVDLGLQMANSSVFSATVRNPKQAYIEKGTALVDLIKCEFNNLKAPIYVPLLPVYLKQNYGNKVLVGAYYIDEDRPIISFCKKEINDYHAKKAEEIAKINEKKAEQKAKRKKRNKIIIICLAIFGILMLPGFISLIKSILTLMT